MRFRTAALLGTVVLALAPALAPSSGAAKVAGAPRASLTDIEADVMCVSCHEPLALAQSPQAITERDYIRRLIGQGQSKTEIEAALVANYGQAVLARPPAHGFNLTVYILPPALVLAGLAMLAITLPRWRQRARDSAGAPVPAGPSLSTDDARRLEEDMARHE